VHANPRTLLAVSQTQLHWLTHDPIQLHSEEWL